MWMWIELSWCVCGFDFFFLPRSKIMHLVKREQSVNTKKKDTKKKVRLGQFPVSISIHPHLLLFHYNFSCEARIAFETITYCQKRKQNIAMLKNIVWPLFLCRFKLSPFKKEGDMLEHHICLSPTSRADELARETAQWTSAKRRSHPGSKS